MLSAHQAKTTITVKDAELSSQLRRTKLNDENEVKTLFLTFADLAPTIAFFHDPVIQVGEHWKCS